LRLSCLLGTTCSFDPSAIASFVATGSQTAAIAAFAAADCSPSSTFVAAETFIIVVSIYQIKRY